MDVDQCCLEQSDACKKELAEERSRSLELQGTSE